MIICGCRKLGVCSEALATSVGNRSWPSCATEALPKRYRSSKACNCRTQRQRRPLGRALLLFPSRPRLARSVEQLRRVGETLSAGNCRECTERRPSASHYLPGGCSATIDREQLVGVGFGARAPMASAWRGRSASLRNPCTQCLPANCSLPHPAPPPSPGAAARRGSLFGRPPTKWRRRNPSAPMASREKLSKCTKAAVGFTTAQVRRPGRAERESMYGAFTPLFSEPM